jgi:methionyl-tRNA formyltransferase
MRIIFFGTPEFSAKVLAFLLEHQIDVVAVITKPDRPKGRSGKPVPTPVKRVAQDHQPSIPVFQPPIVSAPEFASTLVPFKADLFVVVAYGEIIKQHLLEMPQLGCINVHPSLLPKYRGAAPVQHALLNGESKTGVSIMYLAKQMDTGDVIKSQEVNIGSNETFPELEDRLCSLGSKLLLEVIQNLEKGKIFRTPQDHIQATYTKKIELEDCQIDWNKPAQVLHNMIRAVTPDPGTWCYATVRGEKKRLKVLRSELVADRSGQPGEILEYGQKRFVVACGSQAISLLELQLEGKQAMPVHVFMHGLPSNKLSFTS